MQVGVGTSWDDETLGRWLRAETYNVHSAEARQARCAGAGSPSSTVTGSKVQLTSTQGSSCCRPDQLVDEERLLALPCHSSAASRRQADVESCRLRKHAAWRAQYVPKGRIMEVSPYARTR